jgi:hypothetical protein
MGTMSDNPDIVRAFENVNPEFLGIENERTARIIAEHSPIVSKIREIVLQYVSKERGCTVDSNASISISRKLTQPYDGGDIILRLPYEPEREGHFKIREWHLNRVDGSYFNGNIRFKLLLQYQFDIFLGQKNARQFESYAPKLVGNHHVNLWTLPIDVPLELTWYWMNKQYGEPEFSLHSTQGKDLTYNTGIYPTGLFRFFSSGGKEAYDLLLQQGVLTDETYTIIKRRLSWHQQSSPEQQAQIKPAGPSNTPTQTEIPNYAEQLVEIRMEDRARLKAIGKTTMPHSSRGWTEHLKFGSTGGTEPFIERMKLSGLINVEKTPDGTYLRLTDMARKILAAA